MKQNKNKKNSPNHGFGQFLAYSDMLGIKKHVLKLGNSMVASDMSFEPIKNQTKPNQNQKYNQNHGFGQFVAQSDMFGIKKHVLKLGNSAPLCNS